ncbi:bifunctional DNA-formamidopyrimidine glycosylase/DNA-(apurinic or apyrimidinic site) lyase [bacterium]|nr:bifunctional DNA-formamidopyrimidine glycosylase/DNA-(apurinic or apyrimidinic site) lyase [bacterium]
MPELPEVEAIRRQVRRVVMGGRIHKAMVRRRDVVRDRSNHRKGRLFTKDLGRGQVVDSVERRGKQLLVGFSDGGGMVVRLGMSGRITLEDGSKRNPVVAHQHLVWMVESPRPSQSPIRMSFIDPRRFGGVYLFGSVEDCRERLLTGLGPEATSIPGTRLHERLGRTRRMVKAALLDQSVLAGVGNIYADEALHSAGVHPERTGQSISLVEAEKLAVAIRSTLKRAIQAGGSTLRDHVLPDGSPGAFVGEHRVYGRGGKPCLACGKELEMLQIASRSSIFCPRCQR